MGQCRVCSCSQQELAVRSGAPEELSEEEAHPGHFLGPLFPPVSQQEPCEMCCGSVNNTSAVFMGWAPGWPED